MIRCGSRRDTSRRDPHRDGTADARPGHGSRAGPGPRLGAAVLPAPARLPLFSQGPLHDQRNHRRRCRRDHAGPPHQSSSTGGDHTRRAPAGGPDGRTRQATDRLRRTHAERPPHGRGHRAGDPGTRLAPLGSAARRRRLAARLAADRGPAPGDRPHPQRLRPPRVTGRGTPGDRPGRPRGGGRRVGRRHGPAAPSLARAPGGPGAHLPPRQDRAGDRPDPGHPRGHRQIPAALRPAQAPHPYDRRSGSGPGRPPLTLAARPATRSARCRTPPGTPG